MVAPVVESTKWCVFYAEQVSQCCTVYHFLYTLTLMLLNMLADDLQEGEAQHSGLTAIMYVRLSL